jgi:hypothetical protein
MSSEFESLRAEARQRAAASDWAALARLLAAQPRLPPDLVVLAGQAAWGTGRHDAAHAAFAVAVAADPASLEAATRLVQAGISLGRLDAARADLDAALARLGAVPVLAYLAGQLMLDRDTPAAALPWFEAAAEDAGFGEAEVALAALRLLCGLDTETARRFGRPRADARWQSTLWQRGHLPPARLFGTAAALREHALARASLAGLVLEFGVYQGLSIRSLAPGSDGLVHGFDSFEGLPADWANQRRGDLSTGGELPLVPAHVRLHRGWFEHTLPAFLAANPGRVRVAHIDCDLYASTLTVLEALAPRLAPGTVLLFDDLLAYPGYEDHEFRAWHEFAARRQLQYQWLAFTLAGREAALVIL